MPMKSSSFALLIWVDVSKKIGEKNPKMDGENSGKPYQNGWFGGISPTIFGNIHLVGKKTPIHLLPKKQLLDSRLTPAVRCPGFCWLPIRSFSSPLVTETSDSGMTVSCASRGCLVESWLPSTDVQLECTCNMLQPQYPTFTRGLEPKYYNYSQILATSWYKMRLCQQFPWIMTYSKVHYLLICIHITITTICVKKVCPPNYTYPKQPSQEVFGCLASSSQITPSFLPPARNLSNQPDRNDGHLIWPKWRIALRNRPQEGLHPKTPQNQNHKTVLKVCRRLPFGCTWTARTPWTLGRDALAPAQTTSVWFPEFLWTLLRGSKWLSFQFNWRKIPFKNSSVWISIFFWLGLFEMWRDQLMESHSPFVSLCKNRAVRFE